MNKTLWIVLVFIGIAASAAARANKSIIKFIIPTADTTEVKKDTAIIKGDSLVYDSLTLSLKKIPTAQKLYTVAKPIMGKWAKLFVVIKIEESGADYKNSYYATNYFNLTGMRYPGTGRKTTSVGSGSNYYAKFNNWYDCIVDFKYYMDVLDQKFEAKYKHKAANETEMVNFMFGSFNVHQKWKNDVTWLLNHFNYK